MTRQLLALIALLTGLAAVNAPAHAADAAMVACEIGASEECASDNPCAVSLIESHSECAAKSVSAIAILQLSQLPNFSAPSVRIQVDRAYE